MDFTYQSFPNKIYFGQGQLKKIASVVNELGGTRLFVIAEDRTLAIVDDLVTSFGQTNVFHFSKVVQHVPQEVVEEAIELARANKANLIVAIGGGSAIGLAKGMALKNRLPILAVPTTYAGSEMTNVYGISAAGVKNVGRDMVVLPKAVIYDPSLTAGLPLALAATSAMNAMAHLIEALYAHDCNPVTYHLSLTGIKYLKQGMEKLIAEKTLVNANSSLQFGSYLAGKALCEVAMSLHHKVAHVLGGSFNMDHSKVHTVLLPYVLQCQMPGLSASLINDLQTVFNDKKPSNKLQSLAQQMGAAVCLKDIGFEQTNIPKAVGMLNTLKYPNPVAVNETLYQTLLNMAYQGEL